MRAGKPRGFLRRHRVTVASWTALATVSGVLAAYAVTSDGYPVHKAELNDGGVWITNQSMGAVGRQNVPVAQIDARVFDGTGDATRPDLDVFQDGSAVIAVDRGTGSLLPIDAAMGTGLDDQRVTAGAPTSYFAGGSLAVIEKASGKTWVTQVDPETGASSLTDVSREARPTATVGAEALGAVGRDGTVYAASARSSTLLTVRPAEGGVGFAKPEKADLGSGVKGSFEAMSAVGDSPVLLDGKGNVFSASAPLAELGTGTKLQQAGPASDEVVVATPERLVAVGLDGESRTLAELPTQSNVAAPVVMPNGCTFAAWAAGAVGTMGSTCGGGKAALQEFEVFDGAQLVFRMNRNQVVLNDERTGMTWTVSAAGPEQISNWEAFREQPQEQDDANTRKSEAETTQPPQATDDELGARDGRTTVLHVLDNDLIASEGILSIVEVKGVSNPAVEVRIAPDRQSLLATVSPGATGSATFRYTIDDGTAKKTSQDDGAVTLKLRGDSGSGQPELRPNAKARTFPLTSGGAVEFAVTPDWRDYAYGDPIVVEAASASGDARVSTTALGMIRVESPPGSTGGSQKVDYKVTTGGAAVTGSVAIDVVPAGTRTVAAQAEPDVVAGEVDAPITVKPLDNDIPGADASDPGAELVLASRVAPAGGLEVDTDLESGRVTVTGSVPGTYLLDYNAGFGAAPRSAGQIRVDIAPTTPESEKPIAGPDLANVHGMSPAIVDVLANDQDPRGRTLVVQNARPSSPDSQLEVAVIDGRWVRVNATDPHITPSSQSVTYTVSNGANTAHGSVNVTQRPALVGSANAPVAQVDRVTVRAGDTASIPVLDNDTTPSGDPVGLVLDETVPAIGELRVLPVASGTAYVAGRRVRYVAPEDVTGSADLSVQYLVENTGDPTGPTAVGTIKIHVTAPPSASNPNQAPTPRALEGRVVQGDVVTLKLPPVGSDPDGDSVAVTGIATPPRHGRVLAVGANSLTYQAYPDGVGTDEFRYTVTDRFGLTGSASVRVGVVQAGDPQPPLAVDDALKAAPGRTVDVDVLANDLRAPGAEVKILPLDGAPAAAKLLGGKGPIEIVAPEHGRTTRVVYSITNGLDESRGVVTVKGHDGFNNPPDVADIYASPKPGAGSVEVDALAAAVDVDGPESDLRLVDVTGDRLDVGETGETSSSAATDDASAAVRIVGGKVVIPVTDVAQVFAYRVEDGDGAAAAAAIYVPAAPTGAPYAKPGAEITLDPSGTATADLEELVIDPEGDPVRLTEVDTISASPDARVSVEAADTDSLEVFSTKSEGPGAVMFEVTDRKDLDDPEAHRAYISIPVQVGETAPVITCPSEPVLVPEGGASRTIDVASVCHVWTADPADAGELEFTADWADEPVDGVEISSVGGGGLRLEAEGATHGARGKVEIAARGHEATGTLAVQVVDVPAPRLAPIRLDTQAGKAVTVDVAQFVTSFQPADQRKIVVLDVLPVDSATATATHDGSKVTFSPGDDDSGVMRYRVQVSDTGGRTSGQPAVGEVQLAVVGRPDAPTNLRIGSELLANTVALTWTAPDNNGERIDRYEVAYGGKTFSCPGSPCRVTGLDNGAPYSFTVRAHNAVGWSEASAPVRGEADALTGPVRNPRITLARNNALTVQWDPPVPCDCSAVQKYRVSAPGMGNRLVDGNQLTLAVPARNGENTTITIVPLNKKGLADNTGPTNTVTGVAAGAPPTPSAPRLTGTNVAGGNQKSVAISWSPVAANGPGPVRYEVRRGATVVCTWRTATSCNNAGLANDGKVYSYTVRAKNAEADSVREKAAGGAAHHISAQSPATSIEASAPPAAPRITSLSPTGRDGAAKIVFDVGASHGATNVVTCTPSCGQWTFGRAGAKAQTRTLTGLPDGTARSITLTACNGGRSNLCTKSAAKSVTTYGDTGPVSIDASVIGDTRNVKWSITVDPNGKPVNWVVERRHQLYDTWHVVSRATSGNLRFSQSGQELMSETSTYHYRLTVTSSGRTTRTAQDKVTTPNVAGVTVVSPEGPRCGSNCWIVQAKGENFPRASECRAHGGYPESPGATIGQPWSQSNTMIDTGLRLGPNRRYHVRCTNGAISRAYVFVN